MPRDVLRHVEAGVFDTVCNPLCCLFVIFISRRNLLYFGLALVREIDAEAVEVVVVCLIVHIIFQRAFEQDFPLVIMVVVGLAIVVPRLDAEEAALSGRAVADVVRRAGRSN